ncbi:MAG: recombination regulator RecX [Clostridia bacterium]|nr:recombination regulator RecX [Clostridia bacterium]
MDIHETALRYITHRMRTKDEIRKNLIGKGFTAEEADEEIEKLVEIGCVNDKAYAKAYIEYAFEKGKAFVRARQELKTRGIDSETADEAYEEWQAEKEEQEEEGPQRVSADEKQRAYIQALKCLGILGGGESGTAPVTEEKLLAKASRRLASLGYGSDVIYSVIGRLKSGTEE